MKEFVHTRVKVIRTSDGRQCFGWVNQVQKAQMVIELNDQEGWITGDQVNLELIAPNFKALMPSVYCGGLNGKHYFTIAKNYQVTVGRFDVRRKGVVNQCKVTHGDNTFVAQVADVSLYGLAILVPECIEPPTVVQIDLAMCEESGWTASIVAKSVYSRIEPKVSSTWRVGLTILQMNRVDATRWRSILDATCPKECASFGCSNCIHRLLAA